MKGISGLHFIGKLLCFSLMFGTQQRNFQSSKILTFCEMKPVIKSVFFPEYEKGRWFHDVSSSLFAIGIQLLDQVYMFYKCVS